MKKRRVCFLLLLAAWMACMPGQKLAVTSYAASVSEPAEETAVEPDAAGDGTETEGTEGTDGTEGGETGVTDAEGEAAADVTEPAAEPVTQRPQLSAENHKNFAYGEDIVLSGIYGTNTYYFEIPDYWNAEYAYAQIQVSLSGLIEDVPASLTFMANDVPLASYSLDYRDGKEQVFYVEIPADRLNEGYNSFGITGYVRIYDDEGCLDDMSGANWISISEASYIQVGYSLRDDEERLSYYPYPFVSTLDETGSGTYVAVPDDMDNQELEAALMLRADLGDETSGENLVSLVRASAVPASADALIMVARWERLPEEYRATLSDIDSGSLSGKAVVRAVKKSDGTPVLIVTSNDGDCLYEAAAMLMDGERVSQERTDTAYVPAGSSETIRAGAQEDDLASGQYTLGTLMGGGLSFIGLFRSEGDIYLPFSGGYVLSGSGKVDLAFRYSENLDFDRSMITVYWGNVPVASKKLTLENAGGDTLSFTMPNDVVGTYAGSITIAFDLELPDLFCTPRMDEMPWAYVTEDSTFYLPVGEQGAYTFTNRPYPFELASEFNRLLVIIPDSITDVELDTLGLAVSRYGVGISPYGDIQVVRASEASGMDKAGYNIIVIGNRNNNGIISEINESMHFKYEDGGSAFMDNEYLVLSDSYANSIGTLQLMQSPYGETHALLAVAALDDATMGYIRDILREDERVWELEDDAVLIDGEGEIKTFLVSQDSADAGQPILRQLLEEHRETTIFVLVAMGVMLALLLAVILILTRSYIRNKKS